MIIDDTKLKPSLAPVSAYGAHVWQHLPSFKLGEKRASTSFSAIHYRCARCGKQGTAREIRERLSPQCYARTP